MFDPKDDEFISNAIDGRMSNREQASLESRLRNDEVLQRNMNVTRFAIQAAQQLPTAALPRSFTLPAATAQPERGRFDWRFVFRIGSAIAATLFVVLIGLDLSSLLPRPAFQPTPVQAPAPKEAPQPSAATVILSVAPGSQIGIIETVQLTGLPQAPRSPQVVASGAEAAVTAPQARATKSLNTLNKLTPTMVATAIPTALQTAIELTPMPTLAPTLPTEVAQTWATWPRLLAGFALALGAVLAFLGWRK